MDPSTPESMGTLNHEQRHFDISEVYSRKAHTALLSLLGGTPTRTFTCRQWADCERQIAVFYQQLNRTKNAVKGRWKVAQEKYDAAAGLTTQTEGQAAWDLIIDGWLSDPSTAP